MKEVIIEKPKEQVCLEELDEDTPIFAKKNGRFVGMVVSERDRGWILRLGGRLGSTGYHPSREDCLKNGAYYGHSFYVEN